MITSKEDLIQLSDRMKDAQIRKQMILNLKLVGAAPGFHNANYARIAAILTKLFENKFLKNCSWSKQPVVESSISHAAIND
ncbi:hypothetical protein PVAND_014700 [Polypedilum vanderplanki]|uniref:Uncharacterized protein n=1 Tax=Polypedilum vanderplanki TaxID=319348 RepID=A0A9J6BAG8_POLVA|nr:hypothetical protein PVAND_014700 [Polypedilum vanderplanki]